LKAHPYYFSHEDAYKQIQSKGGIGWGNVQTLEKFRDPDVENYLRATVPKLFKNSKNLNALDIGTGSGPTAHILFELGFNVLGIDVSATAIAMAQSIAKKLEKEIEFQSTDLMNLKISGRRFDFIYDSHCFHCIVDSFDRSQAFSSVNSLLNPNGFFILDTMVFRESADMTGGFSSLKFDQNFILWHKTSKNNYSGIVEVDGQLWCPQRRIYPESKILQEVEQAGFRIKQKTIQDQGPEDCYNMQLVLETV
jgi:2-polyprenyl-3-methyl-5-hydroxy-6-metoxy-1,4-benzoquinol methylase